MNGTDKRSHLATSILRAGLAMVLLLVTAGGTAADVLVTKDGERFYGRVKKEKKNVIIFEIMEEGAEGTRMFVLNQLKAIEKPEMYAKRLVDLVTIEDICELRDRAREGHHYDVVEKANRQLSPLYTREVEAAESLDEILQWKPRLEREGFDQLALRCEERANELAEWALQDAKDFEDLMALGEKFDRYGFGELAMQCAVKSLTGAPEKAAEVREELTGTWRTTWHRAAYILQFGELRTAEDAFALAEWCARVPLEAQRRQALQKTIELDPTNVSAQLALGRFELAGMWFYTLGEACAGFGREQSVEDYAKLARLCREKEDWIALAAAIEKAVTIYPTERNRWVGLLQGTPYELTAGSRVEKRKPYKVLSVRVRNAAGLRDQTSGSSGNPRSYSPSSGNCFLLVYLDVQPVLYQPMTRAEAGEVGGDPTEVIDVFVFDTSGALIQGAGRVYRIRFAQDMKENWHPGGCLYKLPRKVGVGKYCFSLVFEVPSSLDVKLFELVIGEGRWRLQ